MAKFSCRTSILSITWGTIQERGHTNVDIEKIHSHKKYHFVIHLRILTGESHCDPLSCKNRTSSLNSTWENTQERDHANLAIVKMVSLRYTWEYTLGRRHIYAAIIAIFFQQAILSISNVEGGGCTPCTKINCLNWFLLIVYGANQYSKQHPDERWHTYWFTYITLMCNLIKKVK